MAPVDTIRVVNVVGSTGIDQDLDLGALFDDLPAAEYDPAQFPGLQYRTEEPAATTLLFRSGKIVTTGAQSESALREAMAEVFAELGRLGIPVQENPEITIQNIVYTADLGQELNLNAIAIGLGLEDLEYEPEQFPGLVLSLDEPSVVVLLFGTGKLVVTGASRREDAHDAVEAVRERLAEVDLLN